MAAVTTLSLLVGVSVVTLLAVLFGIVRRRKRHKSVNLQEGTLGCTINMGVSCWVLGTLRKLAGMHILCIPEIARGDN